MLDDDSNVRKTASSMKEAETFIDALWVEETSH